MNWTITKGSYESPVKASEVLYRQQKLQMLIDWKSCQLSK